MKRIMILFALIAYVVTSWAGDDIKTDYRIALVMAYSPVNSVFEDENLKLEIYGERLWATNKTNRTIFIDLSQCFLIHNGSTYPMFNSIHQDEKKASKKNYSTSIEEFVSIAPASGTEQKETWICNLGGNIYKEYSSIESSSEDFSKYDKRLFTLINELANESLSCDPKGNEYLGSAHRHLTEDESINNIGASIAYAFNKRTEEWSPVTISTWVSDVYLAPYYIEMPRKIKRKEKRGFGIKETESVIEHIKADSPFEFEDDKSPIIFCDWTGKFKKGTFELKSTWIELDKKKSKKERERLLETYGDLAYLYFDMDRFYYKSKINFAGKNDNWGKMSYMSFFDLSQFKYKR